MSTQNPDNSIEASSEVLAVGTSTADVAEDLMDEGEGAVSSCPKGYVLAWLLVVGALVLGAWNFYQHQAHQQIQQQTLAAINKKLIESMDKNEQLRRQIISQESKLSAHESQIESSQQSLQKLEYKTVDHQVDLTLREAASALQIAQWVLVYQKNAQEALHIVQSVYDKVQPISQVGLEPVKRSLRQDVGALKEVPDMALEQLLSDLQYINLKVPSLVTIRPLAPQSHDASTAPKEGWQHFKRQFIDGIKKVVVVKKHGEVQPVLTADSRLVVEQNIQWMLQQAQWALLHRHQSTYQKSLQSASQWIERYFARDAALSQELLAQLEKLVKLDINPDLPDLIRSQQAINQVLQAQVQARNSTSNSWAIGVTPSSSTAGVQTL